MDNNSIQVNNNEKINIVLTVADTQNLIGFLDRVATTGHQERYAMNIIMVAIDQANSQLAKRKQDQEVGKVKENNKK